MAARSPNASDRETIAFVRNLFGASTAALALTGISWRRRDVDRFVRLGRGAGKLTEAEAASLDVIGGDRRIIRDLYDLAYRSRSRGTYRAPATAFDVPGFGRTSIRRMGFDTQVAFLIRVVLFQTHKRPAPSERPRAKRAIIGAIRAMGGDPIGHYYVRVHQGEPHVPRPEIRGIRRVGPPRRGITPG